VPAVVPSGLYQAAAAAVSADSLTYFVQTVSDIRTCVFLLAEPARTFPYHYVTSCFFMACYGTRNVL
jgi:hypothetical protein